MIYLKKFQAKANFLFFLIILLAFAPNRSSAQALTQFYGVNAWLPAAQGGNYETYVTTYQNLRNNSNSNSINSEMVRIGGIEYDRYQKYYTDYQNILIACNSSGANLTPIVQIPVAYFIGQYWQSNPGASWANILNAMLASPPASYKFDLTNLVYSCLLDGVRSGA